MGSGPPYPLVGPPGNERFPLSKPAVGQNIAFHAAPDDMASTYIVLPSRLNNNNNNNNNNEL